MPIANLSSVLINGILSNAESDRICHTSVAMAEIQLKRENVQIPNGLKLHDYANLYFDARNPMMYKRKEEDICVLKIAPEILDLPDVVISDQNASSKYVRFYEPFSAFDELDYNLIYAYVWKDENSFVYYKKKSAKCAEVLVPNRIPANYIIAAAVKNDKDKQRLSDMGFNRKVYVQPDLFFQ